MGARMLAVLGAVVALGVAALEAHRRDMRRVELTDAASDAYRAGVRVGVRSEVARVAAEAEAEQDGASRGLQWPSPAELDESIAGLMANFRQRFGTSPGRPDEFAERDLGSEDDGPYVQLHTDDIVRDSDGGWVWPSRPSERSDQEDRP